MPNKENKVNWSVITFWLSFVIGAAILFLNGFPFWGILFLLPPSIAFIFFINKEDSLEKVSSPSNTVKNSIERPGEYIIDLMKDAVQRIDKIINGNYVPVLNTSLLLDFDETAHFQFYNSILSEVYNQTKRYSTGVDVRVVRGVYWGTYQSQSESHFIIKQVDVGELILTNKKLYFKGDLNFRIIPLEKIMSIDIVRTGERSFELGISILGNKKKEFFSVDNPFFWKECIKIYKAA